MNCTSTGNIANLLKSLLRKLTVIFFILLFYGIASTYVGCSYIKSTVIYNPSQLYFPKVFEPEKIVRSIKFYHYCFKKNDTFFRVLNNLRIPTPQILELVEASKPDYPLTKLKPGQDITLVFNQKTKKVISLRYEIDFKSMLQVKQSAHGFKATVQNIPLKAELKVVTGEISSSVYEDGIQAGLSPQKVLELTDIFSWDLDFFSDLQKRDSFKVLLEEKQREGRTVSSGTILAAEIINNGRVYQAFYFEAAEGKGAYYDETGRSLQKQFLKSPLRFSRISSGFTKRRFHPILKEYRPHLGVDYAAPFGTPIEAVGDGKIIFTGWKSGYGNYIQIRHTNGYVSSYGHLAKCMRGIRDGARVKQGEVIGYVGATGLATGPHLDFRINKDGSFINPLALKNTVAASVSAKKLEGFQKILKMRLAQLTDSDKYIELAKR